MEKPPYKVPSMQEISEIPWNGYSVVSLFSGAGGSSLGYKMAGFRVLWASEFIPAAQEVYRANHYGTILDTRDIRQVQASDILEAIKMEPGQLDLFDGSPPCASFSTAGKREAGWGKVKAYSDTKQRTDDLFFEYARLVKGVQPKVFVAENVSGLVKGTAKGYFLEILAALKECGYNVKAKLLDAQWLGVPQMRQRIIFIGVRKDLGLEPVFPTPLSYRYSVRDALPWIVKQAVANEVYEDASLRDARTVLQSTGNRSSSTLSGEHLNMIEAIEQVEEANGLNSTGLGGHRMIDVEGKPFPTVQAQRPVQVVVRRAYRDKRGAFGNDGDITDTPAPTVLSDSVGTHWIVGVGTKDGMRSLDEPSPSVLTPVRQHTTSELTIVEAETDISRYAIGDEWDKLKPGEQSDKYFQLVKPNPELSCPTITQRGGDNTVASVTHPTEKRKFSIAELKRICAFPDDFELLGTYAQRWERLGRAVPPIMMKHIAQAIAIGVLNKCKP